MWKDCENTQVKFLYFDFGSVNVFAHCHDKQSGDCGFVTHEELNWCQDNIEQQLAGEIPNFAFIFSFYFFSKVYASGCLLDLFWDALFALADVFCSPHVC
jgi:hypothetical protein